MGDFSKPERRRLDSIGTLWFKGQPFKKTDIVETGKYPCLHYGELFSKYGAIIDSVSSRCDVFPKRLSQKGDILFPASDVTPAGLTRCSAIMQEDVILGGDVIGFRPQTGLNPIYLSYAIRHQKTQLLQRVTGALIKHISAKSLQSVIIPIHPIESQDRFEKQVRHLNRIISHRRTQLAKLDELVKCRFVEMFGDPVANDKGWSIVRLDAIADIRIGPFGSLLHKEDYQSGNHALVNPSHIVEGKIKVDTTLSVSNEKYIELSAYWLNPGDIVMGRRGEMGRCAVVEDKGLICGTGSLIIRTHGQMEPYFLQNILSRPEYKKIIEGKAVGVTMLNLNVPIVSALEVPLLPHDQQIDFLNFSHRIDKLRFVIQQSLDETQKLFDSLMQEYFD